MAIFVYGCFWHQHEGCRLAKRKLARNKRRDHPALEQLSALGWHTLVLWECELADVYRLKVILQRLYGVVAALAAFWRWAVGIVYLRFAAGGGPIVS
jgi:G:T-mismatch repair DNA endonuclease (very short patch repair protein)